MDEADLISSRLCLALMRVGTRVAGGFDQHFAGLGLTQAQFRMLLAVWEEGGAEGVTPSDLADRLLIERASVSTLASVMVSRGWLSRVPGENRRSHRLVLTAVGGEVLQAAIPSAVTLADYILSLLGRGELVSLRSLLGRVEERLRKYDPPSTQLPGTQRLATQTLRTQEERS